MSDYSEKKKKIAQEALSAIKEVSEKANDVSRDNLSGRIHTGVTNTINDSATIKNNEKRINTLSKSLEETKRNPIYASVTVKDSVGTVETIYFTKGETIAGTTIILANRRAPKADLLSQEIGDFYPLECKGREEEYEILQKNEFSTKRYNTDWDAEAIFYFDNNFASKEFSLLQLLKSSTSFSFLIETDTDIKQGKLKRDIISSMSLREKPILDKFQNEIFRLSPNQQIILIGAPGTGKTTTLIKKLGLNLDKEYSEIVGDKSWYMFTPTELLKHYLKEAFNREGIAAPEENVFVWKDFAKRIAKDSMQILKTSVKSGFVCDNDEYIKNMAPHKTIELFETFYSWQEAYFINLLMNKYDNAKKINDLKFNEILDDIDVDKNKSISLLEICTLFEKIYEKAKDYLSDLNKELDNFTSNKARSLKVFSGLNDIQIREFLGKMHKNISLELRINNNLSLENENDIDNDFDIDEEEQSNLSSKDINDIWKNYVLQSLKSTSRAFIVKKPLPTKSLNMLVAKYLNLEKDISDEDKKIIGDYVVKISFFKSLKNPLEKYLKNLSMRYKVFRRDKKEYYKELPADANRISFSELNLLLLSYLKICADLHLEKVKDIFRSQIYTDEITDFSPLEIAIMYNLLGNNNKTFFGAGDFNQRLTEKGVTDLSQIKWAIPQLSTKEISVPYRQSKQLVELSQQLIGKTIDDLKQPKYLDLDGLKPVVGYNLTSPLEISKWLTDRILEIDTKLDGKIPSIAILVNDEEHISPLAESLNQKLSEYNIQIDACLGGKILGSENNIRIFSVEYIKGLEFEAAFFINIDELVENKPNVYNKYLYVGVSRAATFLGIACSNNCLPKKLVELEDLFTDSWQ